jgi:hypothetical protein
MVFPVARNKQIASVVFLMLALCCSAISLWYYIHNKFYYVNSDSLYYYGIAENLVHNGSLQYPATDNPQNAGSPQIGIVFIMSLLLALGIAREALFISIVVINFLAHLSCLFPLYKLSRMVGCKSLVQSAAVCSAVLSSRDYFFANINVLNDGIFNVVSLWLIYAVATLLRQIHSQDEHVRKTPRLLLAVSVVLMIVASLFRVQAVLIAASAFLASCVYSATTRRYLMAALSAIIGCASVLTLFTVYRFFPLDPFASTTLSVFGSVFQHATQKTLYFSGNYLLVLVAIALLAKTLLKADKAVTLFLVSVCCLGLFFTFSMKYDSPFDRYLSFIWPLTIILIVRVPLTKYVGYASILLFMLQSFLGCMRAPEYYHRERFFLYLDKSKICCPGPGSLTFSQPDYDRLTHYFLKTKIRFSFDPGKDSLSAANDMFLVGSSDYVDHQLRTIEEQADKQRMRFSRMSLAPGYADEAGNSLIRIFDVSAVTINKNHEN